MSANAHARPGDVPAIQTGPTPGQPAPSRAQRMRAGNLHTLTLPSGHEIIARRVGMLALVQRGLLPDTLTPLVQGMIATSQRNNGVVTPGDVTSFVADIPTMEQLRMTTELWDTTILAIGVDPRFVRVVGDPESEIAVDELSDDDKRFLFDWANGATAELSRFRDEPGRTVPVASESQNLRDSPGRDVGDRPGDGTASGVQPGFGGVVVGDVGGRDVVRPRPEIGQTETHPGGTIERPEPPVARAADD